MNWREYIDKHTVLPDIDAMTIEMDRQRLLGEKEAGRGTPPLYHEHLLELNAIRRDTEDGGTSWRNALLATRHSPAVKIVYGTGLAAGDGIAASSYVEFDVQYKRVMDCYVRTPFPARSSMFKIEHSEALAILKSSKGVIAEHIAVMAIGEICVRAAGSVIERAAGVAASNILNQRRKPLPVFEQVYLGYGNFQGSAGLIGFYEGLEQGVILRAGVAFPGNGEMARHLVSLTMFLGGIGTRGRGAGTSYESVRGNKEQALVLLSEHGMADAAAYLFRLGAERESLLNDDALEFLQNVAVNGMPDTHP